MVSCARIILANGQHYLTIGVIISLCNIFELVFMLCHKCNKYNCLAWNMLNHAGNSFITHRKQLYHPLVYLFCILIRSGSRYNIAVAKQSKQRTGLIKRNKEHTSSVFHFIWFRFYLRMSHNIYHMSSRMTIPE